MSEGVDACSTDRAARVPSTATYSEKYSPGGDLSKKPLLNEILPQIDVIERENLDIDCDLTPRFLPAYPFAALAANSCKVKFRSELCGLKLL